jgi:hypothetical protein
MMKTFKFIPIVALVFSAALFSATGVSGQCNLVAIETDGNIVSSSVISCDFPVYVNTGDTENDRLNFAAEEASYVSNHANDRRTFAEAILNAGAYYIEIHQSDFDVMSEGRKSAILENPSRFHIIE